MEISEASSIHHSVILKGTKIRGEVLIGEGAKLINGINISAKSQVKIGRYSSLNGPSFDIRSMIHSVEIGSFCSLARGSIIQEFNHNTKRISTYFVLQNLLGGNEKSDISSKGPIKIGNDVWIGAQCIVLSGARIGDGAIIGANSVVSGEIPPYAIAVGTPAKVIKYRFSPEVIELLIKLKWWEWELEKIRSNADFFKEPLNIKSLQHLCQKNGIE
ncbi:CatB-related O-acetyltransferase [Lunatibacter salilacus]|uniref:CatB-related O-acetyltransferase n=1 Tax=Lunatibacter salilacus TaxID=2483804 RepID=UPI0018FEB38D|nr:CatB-related O-acetyltransferase [Lunatibacter salilacus]